MAVNRERPHIYVLPEDDRDRQLANGFVQELSTGQHQVYVCKVAGGWTQVLLQFNSDHAGQMKVYNRFMILLIDFDGDAERGKKAARQIPADLIDRVFILGVLTNPEDLRRQLGYSYETIGRSLALECRDDLNATWGHELLRHNSAELVRMRDALRPILF
jgi:hypothetical protein